MFRTREKIVLAALVVATAAVVLVTELAASDPGQGAYKLGGAFIGTNSTGNLWSGWRLRRLAQRVWR
jgi:hypothetical protein